MTTGVDGVKLAGMVYASSSLAWLADAPLFSDERQIGAFYDAVVMPESKTGKTVLETGDDSSFKVSGKVGVDVTVGTSDLFKLFPFLKGEVKVSGEGALDGTTGKQNRQTIELFPITTPQRQLVQLGLHYSTNWKDRLVFLEVKDLSDPKWRSREFVQQTPRAICFMEFPGIEAAETNGLALTKAIPMAAEFADGEVVLLYEALRSRDGRTMPPPYPEYDSTQSAAARAALKHDYWKWFDDEFDPSKATVDLEEAARDHGKIRWIDFRLPINRDSEMLHLHIEPAERYDVGAFAYNFIKRGHKHGLRIVGTLKSGPDVNVLAVFEK